MAHSAASEMSFFPYKMNEYSFKNTDDLHDRTTAKNV